jgi:purine-binding chemotaxis protein CheW
MEQKSETNSYLTFKLGKEEFGAHVSQVLNILEMTKVTEVPKSPNYMKGVINLRGMVLPVIDTRIKFGMPETEYTTNTCIVVMDLDLADDTIHIGAIVDEVVSVIEIEENQIEPPPSIGSKYKSEFIYGMARVEDNFIMLIDMQKLISVDELSEITDKTGIETEKADVPGDER